MANMKPAAAGADILEARFTEAEQAALRSSAGHHPPSFAEYLYWADLKRKEEDADTHVVASQGFGRMFHRMRTGKKYDHTAGLPAAAAVNGSNGSNEKVDSKDKDNGVMVSETASIDEYQGMSEHDREVLTARRLLRQAGWATVFYLVTCDILGPFNAPYSIASIGLVPGALLYVLFGAFAFLGGIMINRIFLRLDSARYPITLYGDMCERTVGSWLKYLSSFLQCTQLTINVGLICLTNGQSLAQIVAGPNGNGHLCFSVCVVIWALCGMCIGLIRSLGNFSILANASVWMNLLIIFISIGFAARSGPNYVAAAAQAIPRGPIQVHATLPGQPLFAQINGVFNMVFAFGGAMIFPEIMAEMRRPRDFVKGMAIAQLLIFSVYMMYGIVLYCLQGQFVQAQSYTGLSLYSGQTICNVFGIITGTIAAGLYGNIGLKVIYRLIIETLFKGPGLMTKRGRVVWSICVVVYWSVAFVLGSGIPAVGALTGLLAAMGFFHFTYTFPPLMMIGLDMQIDGAAEDEPFTTPGVAPRQKDTWRQLSRWRRGFFGGGSRRVLWKCLNLVYVLAALATDGMGLWASGTDLEDVLKAGAASSFGCAAPV